MSEPTKYESEVAQMLLENKQRKDEWEAEMKAHKVEQMHDFCNERTLTESEEE